jgi:DNA polymerase III delta subunit
VKDFLLKGCGDRIVFHKIASEVSKNWIEEEFQTLSLFGGAESFVIHQAQDLKNDVIDLLNTLDLNDRFILLCFDSEGASWKKVIKDAVIPTVVVEAPRFWEVNKLLDFVGAYLRLPLSYEAKNWMLDALENTLGAFYNSCILLKLNHPDSKEISLSDVKNILTLDRLDQFAMASNFSRKKYSAFFERIIALEGNYEKMRGLFNFMQSHLIKLLDPSYLSQKNRLTQYDKEIQGCSKLWSANELFLEVERFNRWEILSKKKDSLIWYEIHVAYLRSIRSLK